MPQGSTEVSHSDASPIGQEMGVVVGQGRGVSPESGDGVGVDERVSVVGVGVTVRGSRQIQLFRSPL
jgi:hypothetical protein